MKKNKLDELTTTLEQIAKTLRGVRAPSKKRMALDEFVTYALAEIRKAGKNKSDVAKQRLAALKRTTDGALAAITKAIADDTDSERIRVEVETAFAPTRADGDTPMTDLTTASDQSSTEVALTQVNAPAGDSLFAENLREVTKALAKLKADLDGEAGGKPRTSASKADRASPRGGEQDQGGDRARGDASDETADGEDGWPVDLNTAAFLKGEAGDEETLTWGADPAEVASANRR